jgi:predicted dehydrogenase
MYIPVIGAGSIGRRHHENLRALGVHSDLLPWRGFDAAAFRQRPADAVVIATATQVRLELVDLCRDLGLPFYVEKPLAHDPVTLERILEAAAPLAQRSMVGFMMRYHPAFRYLAQSDLSSVYDASFAIGHDVRQWRKNWSFAASYAARPDGGGHAHRRAARRGRHAPAVWSAGRFSLLRQPALRGGDGHVYYQGLCRRRGL